MEPAESAYFFASKTKDEVAIRIAAEGESHVHKTDVFATIVVGVTNGIPEWYGVRV